MENEEMKAETAADNQKIRCKGDLRTFVIALLTAVITILIYHCAVSWFCSRSSCTDVQKFYVIHQSADSACRPCRGERKFNGEQRGPAGENKRNFRRFQNGSRNGKNAFRGKRRMNRPAPQENAPDQPAPEQPAPEQKSAE